VLANDLASGTHEVRVEAGTTAALVVPMTTQQGIPVSGWIAVPAPVDVQVYERERLLGSSRSDRIMVAAGRHELDVVNEALGFRVTRVVNVKGIDNENIASVSGLRESIVLGSVDFQGERSNGMVLGLALADRLGAVVGDTVTVVSPVGSELAMLQIGQPFIRRFVVVGIYESNNKEYDGNYSYVGLPAAQSLFRMGEEVHGVEIRLSSIEHSDAYQAKLHETFGSSYRILTWYDLHRELYSVMNIERWMAYVILCLIVGVASFNLLGSLTMTVIEKTRDIGILVSMGAGRKSIQRIFTLQGVFVGLFGSIIGMALGLVLVLLQQEYHLFPLDTTVYIIPAIPTEIQISDVVLVVLTAIFFCSVAALYPARKAAALVPVEAIRWE